MTINTRTAEQILADIARLEGELCSLKGQGLLIKDGEFDVQECPPGGATFTVAWCVPEDANYTYWYASTEAAKAALAEYARKHKRAVADNGFYVDLTAPGCQDSRAYVTRRSEDVGYDKSIWYDAPEDDGPKQWHDGSSDFGDPSVLLGCLADGKRVRVSGPADDGRRVDLVLTAVPAVNITVGQALARLGIARGEKDTLGFRQLSDTVVLDDAALETIAYELSVRQDQETIARSTNPERVRRTMQAWDDGAVGHAHRDQRIAKIKNGIVERFGINA